MPPAVRSRRVARTVALAAAASLAAIIAAGCGDDTEAQARAAEASARKADLALCTKQVKPLQTALSNVEADLGVGINYNAYAEEVRDVARAYAKMDIPAISASSKKVIAAAPTAATDSTCLGAAASFENAFNAYNKANSIWGDCIDNILAYGDCTSGPVNTRIQAQWTKASSAIANGERRLARLETLGDRASTTQE